MEDDIAVLVIGAIIVLFFYFGYKDDYKRNPKEFVTTVIGVFVEGVGWFFGFIGITKFFKKPRKE